MHSKLVLLMMLVELAMCEEVSSNFIEPRGKKKKIALFVYFADLLVKKLFIFKLIYAFILWVIIHKAGYFFTWFISYLKETKSHHHHHEYEHHEYGPAHHHEYGPHGSLHYSSYEPYKRESWSN